MNRGVLSCESGLRFGLRVTIFEYPVSGTSMHSRSIEWTVQHLIFYNEMIHRVASRHSNHSETLKDRTCRRVLTKIPEPNPSRVRCASGVLETRSIVVSEWLDLGQQLMRYFAVRRWLVRWCSIGWRSYPTESPLEAASKYQIRRKRGDPSTDEWAEIASKLPPCGRFKPKHKA